MGIGGLGFKYAAAKDTSFTERIFRVDFIWLKPALR